LSYLLLDGSKVGIHAQTLLANAPLEQDEWVAFPLHLDLILRPVMAMGRVRHGMPHESVSDGLYEEGAPATARFTHQRLRQLANSHHVHAVHLHRLDAVGTGRFQQARVQRQAALRRGPHGIAVVLAHEDDRELPQGGQVEGFMRMATGQCALSKEAQHDGVTFLVLDREGQAGRQGQVPTNNRVSAHEVPLSIHQVHGAAPALAQARRFPEELGHHLAGIRPPGQAMTMLAVGADNIIIPAERGCCSHRHCLLTDVEMEKAGNLRQGVHLRRFFFESADQEHLAIEREEVLTVHENILCRLEARDSRN
jgi:hypothetical protein